LSGRIELTDPAKDCDRCNESVFHILFGEGTMNKAEFYRDARTDLWGPMAGVRVLEATTTAAGPLCGAMLADLGADVIKVEMPQGEVSRGLPPFLPGTNVSFAHGTINRNKRSLSLDLRRRQGCDIFLKLAAKA
jgi:formyl-CoA transferase